MEDRKKNPMNPGKKKEASAKVAVPAEVWQGINVVRYSGLTNMLDRPTVAKLAKQFGFHEAAKWTKEHPKEYAEGIFRGFAVAIEK